MVDPKKLGRWARKRAAGVLKPPKMASGDPLVRSIGDIGRDDVLRLAESAERDKKYALAVLYYEKLMTIWGGDGDFWIRIGALQREMGQYQRALGSILHAIRLRPDAALYHVELGELHLRQKNYADAEQAFHRAVQLNPDWARSAERLAELNAIVSSEDDRDLADQEELIDREERLDRLDRFGRVQGVDPALFAPARLDVVRNHRPAFVTTFVGVHQRTRWGTGPVLRGIGSLRGYMLSITPYHAIEIYIDGALVHRGDVTVGPVQNEQSDTRLRKYAFNAWIDFSQFDHGWHEVIFRGVGLGASMERGVSWAQESVIIDEELPEEFFQEAMARVPRAESGASRSLVDHVRNLPTIVADATPNSYPGPIRKVAVLRLDGLGDVAVSVPFLLKLRELLPSATIVALASADNADGCRMLGIFDEVIDIEFPESPFRQGRFLSKDRQLELIDRLAAYKFDLAITGMVSDGPRELSVMTGAPVTIGFGGDDLKSLNIYFDTRDPKSGGNVLNYAARYGMLVKALEVWLDSGARVQRRDDLDRTALAQYGIAAEDRYVVMHSGSRITSTEWPGYAELANRIVDRQDCKVVYIANNDAQRQALDQRYLADGRIIFLAGLIPFDHFDAFLSYCLVFVGNDSGPGHLATLRGAKAIRIISARLGGSEWKSEMAGVCLYRRMPCAGCCGIPISRPEECAFDIACVKDISVDEVYDQVLRLSAQRDEPAGGEGAAAGSMDRVGEAA